MTQTFYLASGLENREQASRIIRALERAGLTCTYDWTTHGSLQAHPQLWHEVAAAELGGVIRADVVVVLLPGGRGTHCELGAAIRGGTPVVLVGKPEQLEADGRTCIFYHFAGVVKVPDIEAAFDYLHSEMRFGARKAVL